ncbi:MAG: dihydroorotate dehydrogenase electron transfer subunit [Armatimonadota bacterium]|nr:dihydroorotate dehydrogenase electron transfer subunit [Armatimonadota bacterium]
MKQSYCDILENTELTPGTMRLTARDAEIAASSRPGQFVNVLCGHCLDPLLRRPFSIYTVNKERGEFSLLYQVKGRGTVLLSEKEAGEKLDVVGPVGRPFHIDPEENIEHILVGGGCGIVPLLFLADVLREETKGKTVVLIGAQTAGAILCEQEFLQRDLPVELSTDDGTAGRHGFVTDALSEHLRNLPADVQPRIYACGPHEMLKGIARIAANPQPSTLNPQPIPCQVSHESAMACGFGVCMGCAVKTRELHCATEGCEDWTYSRVCVDGPVFYTTELVWE